ncbi:DUF2997 domain-containing protein [Laspinema olomoucense]|uniref:DUF2997 domain-containing protein n=1 Tax=Laspinema olomoucense TaxID=3231600 RepID=UPI0021BB173A|nr:DUF2997 domain-containing protein [Laspinema sp. D3d]MCT7971249.1 DUF2997 domain-containing protein [Laspinema sp. D3d]
MQRIQIQMTVKPDGTIEEQILSTGHGSDCVKTTTELEQSLGEVSDRRLSVDYLQSVNTESDYVQMFEDLAE